MGTITFRVGCILFFCIFIVLSCRDEDIKCCDCIEADGTSDKYEYPIVPGTPEWINLKTGEEMYKACQIPSHTLKSMCPIGLIDSWLTYPLKGNIVAWETLQLGFDKLTDNFNGLSELLNRQDVPKVLLNKYKSINPSGYPVDATAVEKGRYALDFSILEITLAQYKILEKLSQTQREELIKTAFEKRALKLCDGIYYHLEDPYGTSFPTDVYIMAHIMIIEKYEPFLSEIENNYPLTHFVENCKYIFKAEYIGLPERNDNYLKMISHAKNYVNTLFYN